MATSRRGDWIVPAMVADSASERLLTSLLKKRRAASAHAVDAERATLPEVDLVQVQLENLVLRRLPLEHDGHELFLQLPRVIVLLACS